MFKSVLLKIIINLNHHLAKLLHSLLPKSKRLTFVIELSLGTTWQYLNIIELYLDIKELYSDIIKRYLDTIEQYLDKTE